MAYLEHPFDTDRPQDLVRIYTRTEDDLPSYIKRNILWRTDLPTLSPLPGCYLYSESRDTWQPIEFIENYWFFLHIYTGEIFTALDNCIEPHTCGTGYWNPQDPEHFLYDTYHRTARSLAEQATRAYQQLEDRREAVRVAALAEQAERTRQQIEEQKLSSPILTVNTQSLTSFAEDPTLSPFFVPRASSAQQNSSSETASAHTPADTNPSPEQAQPEDPVLQAQFQYRLDVQDREPENPSAPHSSAYQ